MAHTDSVQVLNRDVNHQKTSLRRSAKKKKTVEITVLHLNALKFKYCLTLLGIFGASLIYVLVQPLKSRYVPHLWVFLIC